MFRSLKYKNYRLFFGAQFISLIGTWMQMMAVSWLVYRMTNSAMTLGIVAFSSQIPAFIITPFAGVLIDRWDRRRILIITQMLSLLQALILAILTLTGTIRVWEIIFLSTFMGTLNAFDMPSRQSFLNEIIERKEDLGNAIALNSTIFNGARLIGPCIAGILIAAMGEGICFLINSLSYTAPIIALSVMKIKTREQNPRGTGIFQELKEGLVYALNFAPIKYVLFLTSITTISGITIAVLMPVFARDILHGGPQTQGFLLTSSGIGALTAAIYLASIKNNLKIGKKIPIAAGLFGIGLILFSQSRIFLYSSFFMILTGFSMIVQMASCNTVLQTLADDDKRGRVMSLYTTAFMGTAPLSSLLIGTLASKIGAPATMVAGGIVCIIGAIIFACRLNYLRKEAQPIYSKLSRV